MAKSGPKPVEIDWEQFDKLCFFQCTLREIALWFGCSEDTIENRVKQTHGIRFSEYWAQKAEKGKCSLRRKMWEMALKGDRVMLIWLSKQHLGMSEKLEQKLDQNLPEDKGSLILKVKEKLVEIEKKAEPINITPKQTVDVVEDQVVTYNQNTDPKENN